MRTDRPPRLKSFDYIGFHRYSLTFCTDRRQPLFRDEVAVRLVLSQISRAATEVQCSIIAYCFMPDHVHLLVQGQSESANGRDFVTRAKQYSGYYYRREFGRNLWQRYSYERTLRADEDTRVVARYILENPVRAKLVESVLAYPFVGSLVCELKELIEAAASVGGQCG